jgi:phosphatidylinositol N-acetylglucosaminyltransferase subunit Q
MARLFIYINIFLLWLAFIPCLVIETILACLNFRIPIFRKKPVEVSKTCQQIDLRLQQICFWPSQYIEWRTSDTKLDSKPQSQYIGFWNTVWLIANDIILGISLGSLLMENRYVLQAAFGNWMRVFVSN